MYLTNCFHSANLFGCTGMKKNQYCILNKQYSKDDYSKLCLKLVNHMKETGEWGRFFPMNCSPFPFNNSVSSEYYPVSRLEAKSKGLHWLEEKDETLKSEGENILQCEISGKSFKLTKSEMLFYEKMNLPFPKISPKIRHDMRMQRVKRAIVNYC